jgi:D-sedoheptulose 7-phosphate isomerase
MGKVDNQISILIKSRRVELEKTVGQAIGQIESNQDLVKMISTIMKALSNGRKIAFAGNGGSAAEAMHITAEFTGKCVRPHDPWPVICLNESQSALTAIGNDYGFDQVFSRMVRAHLDKGDVLVLLSTSGTSGNILEAIKWAHQKKVQTYLWTGKNSPTQDSKGLTVLRAPAEETPRIQEIHLIWGHLLAEILEEIKK